MTVEELKSEAAKLPPDDRFALAEWIEQSEDIRELRRAALVREIEIGLDQLDRGMTWDAIVGEWRGKVCKEAIAEAIAGNLVRDTR